MLAAKKRAGKNKSFKWLVFIEVLSIFLSVLLAFSIENMRQDYNNNKIAEESIQSIINELELNVQAIEDIKEGRQAIIDSLQIIIKEIDSGKKVTSMDIIQRSIFSTGFMVATVQSSAWQTAGNTGALQFFDMELAHRLAQLYEWQEDGLKLNYKKFSDFIFDTTRLNDELAKENATMFLMILLNIQNMENSTQVNIQKLLDSLE